MQEPQGECQKCGQPYTTDPSGSPGVLMHLDDDSNIAYDLDREHVPVPEEE